MAKGFLTDTTFIGFLSCMNSLMDSQGGAMAKGLSTHITFIGSLSSMNSLMLNKSYVIGEGFPTVNTIKGLFSSVTIPSMTYKRSVLLKGFPTCSNQQGGVTLRTADQLHMKLHCG